MADGDYHYQAAMSITVTTTGNIDNLDIDGVGMLLMNNASAATLRGIDAGYHGQMLGVWSIGAGSLTLNHQDTNSTAANRIITPGADATVISYALLQYDGVTARWRVLKMETPWNAIAFDAANFTGSGTITWTVASGDQTAFAYKIVDGNTAVVNIRIETTSVSGAGNQLNVALPTVITPIDSVAGPALIADNGNLSVGFFTITGGVASVGFLRIDTANWAAATDATSVYLVITYKI